MVQTSALGGVVPVGWGTGRLKVNLLWYSGFKALAHTTKTGGKGGGGVEQTTYSYSASLIMGICWGPITGVTQVYRDKSQFASVAAAGLSLATGAIGQAVWGYLTTNYPAQALGYSGMAYLYASNYALTDSATLPNHSVEVKFAIRQGTLPDANPKDILTDALTNTLYGVPGWGAGLIDDLTDYGNYCLAANLLLSPVLDAQAPASQVIADLMRASNSNCYWSEGLLKVRPYGDATVTGNATTWVPALSPVYALNDDYFLQTDSGDDPPVLIDKQDQSDAYNVVQVEWLDRANQYNIAIATAEDMANISSYGRRKQDPIALHAINNAATAKVVTQLILQRTLYVRDKFHFELPWSFALLEQMDLLSITDTGLGVVNQLVRITSIDDDSDSCRQIEAEPVLVGTAGAPIYNLQISSGGVINQDVDPGTVECNLVLSAEDMSAATYTKTRLNITANATTAPDGRATADKCIPTAVSGTHVISVASIAIAASGLPVTFSVYAKASTRKVIRLQVADAATGVNSAQITFDTNAGTVFTAGSASGTGAFVGGSITAVGSGWYRCDLLASIPSAAILAQVNLCDDAGATTWTGDAVNGVFLWGWQFAPGTATLAYCPTGPARQAVPYLFNPPSALTPAGVEAWAAIASNNPNWGGANVWTSTDGTNYSLAGTLNGPSRFGVLTTDLATHVDPDSADTLSVNLAQSIADLGTPSHSDADTSATISLIDTELVAYGASSLTAANCYDLTYLRRGVLNSTIAAHVAGATFVRLDSGVFHFPYLATQAGEVVHVKFQSFNVYGRALQDLANCVDYTVVPFPVGSRPPVSTAWTAVGTSFQANGKSIPAIVITGASDNASAEGVVFLYRVSGATIWASAGVDPITITRKEITTVSDVTAYEVGVQYVVNGVPGQIFSIGTVTTGSLSTGPVDGSILFEDSVAGAGKTWQVPVGYTLGHIEIQLVGPGGNGNFIASGGGGKGGGSISYFGGGGGGLSDKTNIVATVGMTVTYTITAGGSVSAAAASIVSPAVSLSSNGGTNATTSASGTGGTATGGTTNTTGRNGGLTNSWDGGGCGGGVDQTSVGQGGTTPGGGGAGAYYDSASGTYIAAPGSASRIRIIART